MQSVIKNGKFCLKCTFSVLNCPKKSQVMKKKNFYIVLDLTNIVFNREKYLIKVFTIYRCYTDKHDVHRYIVDIMHTLTLFHKLFVSHHILHWIEWCSWIKFCVMNIFCYSIWFYYLIIFNSFSVYCQRNWWCDL